MPLPDYDLTDIDDQGRARLKANPDAVEQFMKVVSGCPCDECPMARVRRVECRTFKGWVQTGKC
ncbi:MAG: hypothetical protein U9R74_06975 [Pseudomonadota bacterium]|nr:hypothetical protein [Pseudomonadota bacterium]